MRFLTKCFLYLSIVVGVAFITPPVYAQQNEQQQEKDKKIPLSEAIEKISKRFNIKFAYEHNLLTGKHTTLKNMEGNTASEVLKDVLYPNNLLFLYVNQNSYSIVARNSSFFQYNNNHVKENTDNTSIESKSLVINTGRTVRGVVINEKGVAMPFVSIWVKGTRRGTQTGDRGEFILENLKPSDSLVFSYLGYNNEVIAVGNYATVTVQMYQLKDFVLDEVKVVSNGLQQLPKERATGSFASLSAADIAKTSSPNVLQRMEGQITGVKIGVLSGDRSFMYSTGNQLSINGGTRTIGNNDYGITIRGVGTLSAESFPLIVVDGAITDMDISTVNPDDIENITFLKDAAAASIWGVRATNGVIVVTTKKGKLNQAPAVSFSMNTSFSGKPDIGYLRMMNSSQMLNYETELVNRGFMTSSNINASSYSYASYYPNTGAALALKLKAGLITQDVYNAAIDSLSKIDNTSQIQKYLLQPSSSQQYNLSLSGGNYNSNYFYSLSYSRELPNARRSVGQRLTITLNNSWKIFKIATLSTSIKGTFFKYNNDGLGISSLYPKTGSTTLMPYMKIADDNGNGISYDRLNPDFTKTLPRGAFVNWKYNYLTDLNNQDDIQKDNNYSVNVNLNVPIYKGLSGSVQYTNEKTFSNHKVYYDTATYFYRNMVNYNTPPTATTANGLAITSGGILSLVNTTVNNYALRGQLAYDRTIGEHQINAIAGGEMRETQEGQNTATLYGYNPATGLSTNVSFLSNSYTNINGYATALAGLPTQIDKIRRYLSYFSNAAYTFRQRYSLSGSVRYDDYNNFGLDRKYRATPLWSMGVKWALSKEKFIQKINWIDNLNVKATYGVTGNISTTIYPFTALSLGSTDLTTGLPYALVVSLANPELRWEKTYITNFGIDYSIFKNLLYGSIDIYHKKGKDLLYSFPINPAYAGNIGGGYLTTNTGSMTNKGFDLSINSRIIKRKNFSWNIGVTLSYNTNKITDSRFDTAKVSSSYFSYTPAYITNLKGYSTDKLFVFRNAGLTATGLTKVYNKAGDTVLPTSTLSFSDLKYAGRTTAPYFGGFTNSAVYKNFTLYVLMTYQFGGVFLKPSINNYITSYYSLNYSVSGDIAKRWEKSGDEAKTKVPGLNGTATQVTYSLNRYQYSDINVLSSDYIRLREISLTYEVPSILLQKLFIKGISAGISIRNLGLLWKANKQGYDPDFVSYANGSYSLPASKSYNFSLKVNF